MSSEAFRGASRAASVASVATSPRQVSREQAAPKDIIDSYRDDLRALETRLVRHVEEVTSGSEATQNLLRNELTQEMERLADRHAAQLNKGESANTELASRLDEAEKRFRAAQQDQVSEMVSLRSRLEAVIGERLSCKVGESEQRLMSLHQEHVKELDALRAQAGEFRHSHRDVLAQVAEVRCRVDEYQRGTSSETLARLDEFGRVVAAASEEHGDIRQKIGRMQARLEEDMVRFTCESLAMATRLEAVEQQATKLLPQASALPSINEASTLPAAIEKTLASLSTRLDAVEEHSSSCVYTPPSVVFPPPRSEVTEHEANSSTPAAAKITVLQSGLAETQTNVERMTRELALLRTLFDDRARDVQTAHELAGAGSDEKQAERDAKIREIVARCVGDRDAELRAEFASSLVDVQSGLASDLPERVAERLSKTEASMVASVKASLGAGFQAAMSELCLEMRKLQTRFSEVEKVNPRLTKLEDELRGTSRLVTSLANRALQDGSHSADERGTILYSASSDAEFQNQHGKRSEDVMQAIESVIQNVLNPVTEGALNAADSSSFKTPHAASSADLTTASGSTAAEISSDVLLMARESSDTSQFGSMSVSEKDCVLGKSPAPSAEDQPALFSNGLMESLQGLAVAIDKTLGSRGNTQSPEPTRNLLCQGGVIATGHSKTAAERSRTPCSFASLKAPVGRPSTTTSAHACESEEAAATNSQPLSARGRSPVGALVSRPSISIRGSAQNSQIESASLARQVHERLGQSLQPQGCSLTPRVGVASRPNMTQMNALSSTSPTRAPRTPQLSGRPDGANPQILSVRQPLTSRQS